MSCNVRPTPHMAHWHCHQRFGPSNKSLEWSGAGRRNGISFSLHLSCMQQITVTIQYPTKSFLHIAVEFFIANIIRRDVSFEPFVISRFQFGNIWSSAMMLGQHVLILQQSSKCYALSCFFPTNRAICLLGGEGVRQKEWEIGK